MSISRLRSLVSFLASRRLAVMLPIGFASGIPLALTSGTLQAWLTVDGVDIRTIGLFSLVGIPYTLKFFWSPVMDRFCPPWLGRRRGWILLTQGTLVLGIFSMAFIAPADAPFLMACLALMVAFSSASQDIVIDAYRTDLLEEKERGFGVGLSVTGYRIAMLVSGALALILSDRIGWQNTYILMAGIMSLGILGTLAGPEPRLSLSPPGSMAEAISGPLKEFFSRPAAISMLVLIVLYKLGDAFAGTLTTAFLIRGVGFSPTDVGTINKGFGLVATIGGALLGGGLMAKIGLFGALMFFGVLQAVSNLSFMVLAWIGKSYCAMIAAVGFENLSGGMGTAAFVAFLMALCNHRFTATQYALLSALASLGRVFVGPPSGFLVNWVGWPQFFFITTLVALPGLILLWWMKRHVSCLEKGL
ncbi:MAG: MFS transporter [Deltaproteobacteria bacterium]|nr:MFS transporter [Deltaproteobacteria bacterium]